MRTRALLAAAVTTLALTSCDRTDATPRIVGETAPIAPSVPDGTPVPAVVGRPLADARRLLERAGFRVNEVEVLDCRVMGRATATAPVPGTPIGAGSTVTLTYSDVGPAGDCVYSAEERVWRFLDWADGRGSDNPLFDRRLGDLTTTPPARWGHAAEIAHAAFDLVPTGDGTSAQPTMTAKEAACDGDCAPGIEVRLELAGRPYAGFLLLLRRSRIMDYVLEQAPATAP